MHFAGLHDTTPYIFLLVGLILAIVPRLFANSNKQLLATGLRVEGIIFKLDYQPTGSIQSSGETITKDKITVRFTTQTKEWITADLNTNGIFLFPGQFKEGQSVSVVYDPANPTDFTLENLQGQKAGQKVFVIVGVLVFAFGCYMLIAGTPTLNSN
jgi:hypothetical protein